MIILRDANNLGDWNGPSDWRGHSMTSWLGEAMSLLDA